jgi:chromatin remodeling complex protein RSC6
MAKKQSSKAKKSTPPKEEPVPAPVEETVVVETAEQPVEEDNYDNEFTELTDSLKEAGNIIKSLVSRVNALEKRVGRDRKVMNKKMRGRVRRVVDPNKPPSGFAKPGPISEDLRKFLGLGKEDLIARTEVTKRINAYCKEHKLQKEEDKRTIHPDATLRKLLKLSKGDELTFFNLQKYMKIHYPNKEGVFSS